MAWPIPEDYDPNEGGGPGGPVLSPQQLYQLSVGKQAPALATPDPHQVTSVPPQEGIPGDEEEYAQGIKRQQQFNQAYRDLAGQGQGQGPPMAVGGGHFLGRVGGYPAMQALGRSYEAMDQGTQQAGGFGAYGAAAQAELMQQERERAEYAAQLEARQREIEAQELRSRLKQLEEQTEALAKVKIDQGRAFRSPAGVLGAITASFLSFAGDPYAGVRQINATVDRDINAQIADINSRKAGIDAKRGLLHEYLSVVRDEQAARALTEAKMKELAANKLMEVATRFRSPQILAEARVKQGMLMHDATLLRMDTLQKLFVDYKQMPQILKDLYGFERVDKDPTKTDELFGQPGQYGTTRPEIKVPPQEIKSGGPPGWDTSKGGEWSRDDIEAIKSGGGSSGGQQEIQLPVQEMVSERPSGPSGKSVPNTPQARAIEKVILEKKPNLRVAYEDPTVSAAIADAKNTYEASILERHPGNYALARKEWLARLDKAVENTGKIATAEKEHVKQENTVSRVRERMRAFRSRLGPRANEVWGHLRNGGVSPELVGRLKLMLGSDEAAKAEERELRAMDSDMEALKYYVAHGFLGTISEKDKATARQIVNYSGDIQTADEALQRISQDTNASKQNAIDQAGDPLAKILWKASHPERSKAQPMKNIPGAKKVK